MTLNEKYYQINKAIADYFTAQKIKCPVIKYGIDPARLKADEFDNSSMRYPYIKTFISNIIPASWTTKGSGIFTEFDFHMNYFFAPVSEYKKDSKNYYPFEVAKNALADIDENILSGIANILSTVYETAFELISSQPVSQMSVIYRMNAVCSYVAQPKESGFAVDVDSAIGINA